MFKFNSQPFFNADTGAEGGADQSSDNTSGNTNDGTEGTGTNQNGQGQEQNKGEALTADMVQKMIQSETDKVRTEYSKQLKTKDKELEDLRVSKMSEEEKQSHEFKKLQDSLNTKEAELILKEMTLTTIDLLKEHSLPLEAKDFLIGKDAEMTKKNIESFKAMFNGAVEAVVAERFKENGQGHKQGSEGKVVYTPEMLKTMTSAEINANWEKIQVDLKQG